MKTVIRSAKFYFYPIIAANMMAMTLAVDGDVKRAAIFSLVISFLSSFGFMINDLWDIDIDEINKPGHLEGSSIRVLKVAAAACASFLISAFILAFNIGMLEFILAIIIAFGLTAYTVLLRRFLLAPNIVAAVLASSPLWIPLVLWSKDFDKSKLLFVGAIIAIITAREILMDTRDVAGDAVGGRDTFATIFSERIAKFVGVILTLTACVPLITSMVSITYDISLISQILAITLTGLILYLLIPSAIKTFLSPYDERKALLSYVTRSRRAMALIPLLVILLWYR